MTMRKGAGGFGDRSGEISRLAKDGDMVRLEDRRRRGNKSGQLWRHLRAAMRLLLRHPTLSVGMIPVYPDGRIVLARRVDSDRFAVPGGIVDWGETIEEAAKRELEEETGLEWVRTIRLVGVYSSPARDPRTHSVNVALALEVRGDPSIRDPLEISEIHAFAPADIPYDFLAFDGEQQLRDYLDGTVAVR
jgi:8-oxo-dGTP diphosphatase